MPVIKRQWTSPFILPERFPPLVQETLGKKWIWASKQDASSSRQSMTGFACLLCKFTLIHIVILTRSFFKIISSSSLIIQKWKLNNIYWGSSTNRNVHQGEVLSSYQSHLENILRKLICHVVFIVVLLQTKDAMFAVQSSANFHFLPTLVVAM